MGRSIRVLMLLAYGLAAACGSDPTQLIVVVDTDLSIPSELDAVHIQIVGPSGTPIDVDESLSEPGAPTLPLTLGLSPTGDALGPVEVAATGALAGTDIITRRARTTLVKGETRVLRLFLLRDCLGVACGMDESCGEAGCGTIDVPWSDLPEWNGTPPRIDAGIDRMDAGGDAGVGNDAGPPECTSAADCDDGSFCNGPETCVVGECAPGAAPVCDDGIACTADSCDDTSSGCLHVPDDALCTAVADGHCEAATGCQYPVCDDATCTAGACQSARCMGTTCVRTNSCASDEMCCGGACVPMGCDDDNPCTDDSCGASGCAHSNNMNPCDDGNMCTSSDRCSGGSCTSGGAVTCNDGNPCTDDGCNPSMGCTATNNTRSCDDGDACTTSDVCSGGSCSGSTGAACDDGNQCTDDSCSPSSGCVHTPHTRTCNDGDGCTTGERCSGGTCTGGSPRVCDDGNPCTSNNCVAGGCVYPNLPTGTPCGPPPSAGSCDAQDTCSAGTCRDIRAPVTRSCTAGQPYCNAKCTDCYEYNCSMITWFCAPDCYTVGGLDAWCDCP